MSETPDDATGAPPPSSACAHCGAAIAGRSPLCPDCRETASPWRVDASALAAACLYLGVDVPVRIRRMHARKTPLMRLLTSRAMTQGPYVREADDVDAVVAIATNGDAKELHSLLLERFVPRAPCEDDEGNWE